MARIAIACNGGERRAAAGRVRVNQLELYQRGAQKRANASVWFDLFEVRFGHLTKALTGNQIENLIGFAVDLLGGKKRAIGFAGPDFLGLPELKHGLRLGQAGAGHGVDRRFNCLA